MTRSTSEASLRGSTRPARQQRRAAQRDRIVEAAREVFFRDGFMEANLDDVARLAAVAKGTLYRYFENKAELYVAVLSRNGEIFERRMREAAAASSDPAERIRRVGRFYLDHWSRHREYFEIFWALENQPVIGRLPGAVSEEVTRLWQSCLQILSDVIEQGVAAGAFRACDPWTVANVLWTAANGLIRSALLDPERGGRSRALGSVFDDMVELFLRGLETREPIRAGNVESR